MFYKVYNRYGKELHAGTEKSIARYFEGRETYVFKNQDSLSAEEFEEDFEFDLQNLEDESVYSFGLKDFCGKYDFSYEPTEITPELVENYLMDLDRTKSNHINSFIGVTEEEAWGIGQTLKDQKDPFNRVDYPVDVLSKQEYIEFSKNEGATELYREFLDDTDVVILTYSDSDPIVVESPNNFEIEGYKNSTISDEFLSKVKEEPLSSEESELNRDTIKFSMAHGDSERSIEVPMSELTGYKEFDYPYETTYYGQSETTSEEYEQFKENMDSIIDEFELNNHNVAFTEAVNELHEWYQEREAEYEQELDDELEL